MINKETFYNDIKKRAEFIYQDYQQLILHSFNLDISNYTLKFHLNNDQNIGGKAWSKDQVDHILINTGVIDKYFDYFHDFKKEQISKKIKSLSIDDIESFSYEFLKFDRIGNVKHFDSKIIEFKLPSLLTIFVSRFIVAHELGNLLKGHCEYLDSKENDNVQYMPMANV